jgi:hypothetical protein
MAGPEYHKSADTIVDAILRVVGPNIVLGLPLGLGKANTIANAFFARAMADRSIRLNIFTALTLEAPHPSSEIERRFMQPVVERLMGGTPPLAYAKALRAGPLPPNIEVNEFFFQAGTWLSNPHAQQTYISANYTHAARYLIDRGVNVVAQLVAKREEGGATRYSLSCNTDTTLDVLKARAEGRAKFVLAGQVNSELPFMTGPGDLPADTFSYILDDPSADYPLFAPPKEPVALRDYAIGLHAARLVPDGGTLQIGIGQESDAAVRALIIRHHDTRAYDDAIARLTDNSPPLAIEHRSKFETGLYGVSEMFVDGFLELLKAGILKREVDGVLLHGAFFLGTRAFYRALREMPETTRAKLQMSAVSFTNELYGDEAAKTRARVGARFVNNAMMATLLGDVISDTLEDGRVVSGVGGQYNFVAQAFALPDARSILTLKAARGAGAKAISNIRWRYGQTTIPRHLRDIVITEYGIADLRGKSDAATIAAMLSIADSRFQPELLKAAKDARKIPASFTIPAAFCDNTPERIERALAPLRDSGLLPAYPFGTDFDATEQRLLGALEGLKGAPTAQLLRRAIKGFLKGAHSDDDRAALRRLKLDTPSSLAERFYRALVLGTLTQ